MMNEEKSYNITVNPVSTCSETGTLCELNSASNIVVHSLNDINSDGNAEIVASLGQCTDIHVSANENLDGKGDLSNVMKIDSIGDLGGNGATDMTVLLNQGIRTHVASDVNLGSLGDLSDTLAVSESALEHQLKEDGK